jgi:hypothetical protein
MNEYNCQRCGKLIPEDEGITCLNGYWVCDNDTCRTLDDENEAYMIPFERDIPRIEPPSNIGQLKRQISALEAFILTDTDEFSLQVHKQALKDLKAELEKIASKEKDPE